MHPTNNGMRLNHDDPELGLPHKFSVFFVRAGVSGGNVKAHQELPTCIQEGWNCADHNGIEFSSCWQAARRLARLPFPIRVRATLGSTAC